MSECMLINLYKPAKKSGFTPPLGILYLLSALEKAGHPVVFRDFQFELYEEKFRPAAAAEAVDEKVKVVGIGFMCDLLPLAVLAAREIKRKRPDVFIMFGGPGAGGLEIPIMKHFPFIDMVVCGEGDETIVEVVNCLDSGNTHSLGKIKGICYRDNGVPAATPVRPRIGNIDALPMPAYHLADFSRYTAANIATGRGCPFSCTFCSTSPFWRHRNRSRSLDSVTAEIKLLRETYGIERFDLSDDTFTLDRTRVLDFCDRVRTEAPGISWNCYSKVDLLDEMMLEQMAGSGCRTLYVGAESGSDDILAKVKKRIRVRDIVRVLAFAKEFAQIKTHFIWGFPFESFRDFQLTVMCAAYLQEMGISGFLTPLIPLPLSHLYNEYKQDIIYSLEDSYSKLKTICSSREILDLVQEYPRCFPMFYSFKTPDCEKKLRIIKQPQWLYPFGGAV